MVVTTTLLGGEHISKMAQLNPAKQFDTSYQEFEVTENFADFLDRVATSKSTSFSLV
ncbi:MAG: hypothetical protein ACI901_000373 [Octadecabacter sp.]|jgi:hypothetical protein